MGRSEGQINHTTEDVEGSAGRFTALGILIPLMTWAVGLIVIAWPTFASGFRKVQGGLGDSRLVNFSLEHSYRWLTGMPLAEDLWSPPIFFPVQNVAAYTDLMLGVAPFYWVWRWLGSNPHTAYQLWMLSCWTLNFFACFVLLHRGLRLQLLGAAAGAYLFAFGSPRYMSMAHQQLVPQFWLLIMLAGLIVIFGGARQSSPAGRWMASSAFWFGLVAQLYTAVYPLAFFALGIATATAFTLILRPTRERLFSSLREHAAPLAVTAVIAVALSAPLAIKYRTAAQTLGMHSTAQVHLPKPLSWILPGNSNRVYGEMLKALDLEDYRGLSQTNGVGGATLIACAVGLWLGRRRRVVQLMVAGLGGLVLLTVTFPGGWSPWWIVREIVPGASALRAVARVGHMTLYPAALGLALLVEALTARRRWVFAAVVVSCVMVEQPHRRPSFDKASTMARVELIAARVPAETETFLLAVTGSSWDKYLHDDAAWVALEAGIPTVNGRYGHFPPDYPFREPWIQGPTDAENIRKSLSAWAGNHDLAARGVRLIGVAPRAVGKRARSASPGPQVEAQD
jgi:hypothetical protein